MPEGVPYVEGFLGVSSVAIIYVSVKYSETNILELWSWSHNFGMICHLSGTLVNFSKPQFPICQIRGLMFPNPLI